MTRIFRHGTLRGKVAQAASELVRQPQRHLIASTDSDAAFARLSGPRAHFPACAAEPVSVKSAPGPPGCLALWGNKSGNVLALLVLVRDTASTHAKASCDCLQKAESALRQFSSWDLVSADVADVVLRIITALDDLVGYSRCSWMWLIDSCEQYMADAARKADTARAGAVAGCNVQWPRQGLCVTVSSRLWKLVHRQQVAVGSIIERNFVWPDEVEGLSALASTHGRFAFGLAFLRPRR